MPNKRPSSDAERRGLAMTLGTTRHSPMPEITRFYGIIIKLFFGDHPPPHFHAVYGERNALFDIETLEMIEGDLPPRAKKLVSEWATEYQADL
ncbi:MAG: hypothetical protein N838_33820 [Thiohalocapsa sp. PB-PSB1]|jgi:hypothetical protein|nr:MAG: hypothetical protein N838_33820 [Thiohalocapsa sp. PB-PSB1]